MAKSKSKWVCIECGYETASYLGKCPECENWSSFKEEKIFTGPKTKNQEIIDHFDSYMGPQPLEKIAVEEDICFDTGFFEFDRVLGNGIVENSLILIGGDPGIGKSTLLLQMCGNLSAKGITSLYISAEESPKQVKLRADRLSVHSQNIYIYAQTNVNSILQEGKKLKPKVIVVDSIQAIYNPELPGLPGSVSQIRDCSNSLLSLAKYGSASVFIIGHVTKDGAIAGPKVLEHIVDTVLYFEGDKFKTYRILRTVKNRYGNTNEIGIFNMRSLGLEEVSNPSELFLSQHTDDPSPGMSIVASMEGTRPLLVEVQSLVGPTSYPSPRRVANGVEYNRLLQILAVLEKKVGISLAKHDVYTNIVGGITVDEPAADLGIAMAILSSIRNVVIDPSTVFIGEIGLTGEIRAVSNVETRIKEALKQGFKNIILPEASKTEELEKYEITQIYVGRLVEAIAKSISIAKQKNQHKGVIKGFEDIILSETKDLKTAIRNMLEKKVCMFFLSKSDQLKKFIKKLRHQKSKTRAEAIKALGLILQDINTNQEALEALVETLKDPVAEVREQAFYALTKLDYSPVNDEDKAYYQIEKAFRHSDVTNSDRKESAQDHWRDIIQVEAVPTEYFCAPLLLSLEDKYRFDYACFVLGELQDTKAVDTLVQWIDKNPTKKKIIIEALGKIKDPKTVPLLLDNLRDKEVCVSSAVALGNIGDPQAVDTLISLLQRLSKVEEVHKLFGYGSLVGKNLFYAIFEALCKIGDTRAIEPILLSIAQEGELYTYWVGNLKYLKQFGDPAIPVLLHLLSKYSDANVNWFLAELIPLALGVFRSQDAVEPLITYMKKNKKYDSAFAAAEALGQIGGRKALEALQEFLLESNHHYRVKNALYAFDLNQ